MVELVYVGERGQASIFVQDKIEDELGKWLGVRLKGTNIAGLRHWWLNRGGSAVRFYLSQEPVEEEKRVLQEGLGYTEKFKIITERPVEGWAFNCEDVPAEPTAVAETGDLMRAAQGLGFTGGEPEGRSEARVEKRKSEVDQEGEDRPTSKRRRVKAMLARARWSPKGTTVDPRYRREVSLKLRKKKKSSSSGGTSSGSETSSHGIGDEHQLRSIAKRLPGYLARRSAKEALEALAQDTGEEMENYQVFVRYHRQVVASRGGARPLLRDVDVGHLDGHLAEGGGATEPRCHRPEVEVFGAASARSGRRRGQAAGADPGGGLVISNDVRSTLCPGRASCRPEAQEAADGEDPASFQPRRLERPGKGREPGGKGLGEEGGKGEQGQGRKGQGVEGGEGRLLSAPVQALMIPREEGRPPGFSVQPHCHAGESLVRAAADEVLRDAAGAVAGGALEAPRQERMESSVHARDLGNQAHGGQADTSGNVGARLADLAFKMLSCRPPSSRRVSREHTQEITEDAFPLPLPRDHRDSVGNVFHAWEEGLIRSLNWLSSGSFEVSGDPPSRDQSVLLDEIRHLGPLIELWSGQDISKMNPSELFEQKLINSYGEEVHVARSVRWENVSESLPKKGIAGIVPAVEVCEGGFKDYVMHPSRWPKPEEERVYLSPPKVMVPREDWSEVCQGLVDRGICGLMPLSEAFCVEGQPVLGGIFGVPKNETTAEGVDILRLIMDLRPINECFLNLGGDLSTLPVMSQMIQLELSPEEGILVSSEDIRAMFYIIGVPDAWRPFLGFSRPVPRELRPVGAQEEYVLYSKVLPMGFVNSVAIAQHLHRNITGRALQGSISSQQEIRRDREMPIAKKYFRVYLDNFDELSIRSKGILEADSVSLVELLRKEYLRLGVPRNEKKAVANSLTAEVQGAWVDGDRGICSAKPEKVAKYLCCLVDLLHRKEVSQQQLQMLVGGLVYMFSYRRPLMSCLNEVWSFIVRFKQGRKFLPLPHKVREELWAAFFLSMTSFMDFRLPTDPVVTASDASQAGGGLCSSAGLTSFGLKASTSHVRGDMFEGFEEGGLLVVSVFDGIGSLRIALDALGAEVAGYVSVESCPAARRVVESAFPMVISLSDIREVSKEVVQQWAAAFPKVRGVLLGGGPPCQGVSGLNASRRGALEDPRSSLYQHYVRVRDLITETFRWCSVHFVMESVSSMDEKDRAIYSRAVGILPYQVDARDVSLCRRPRLWWFNWSLSDRPGMEIVNPATSQAQDYGEIFLEAQVNERDFLKPGWNRVDGSRPFSTFTTAQASAKPRFAPAGLSKSSAADRSAWQKDRHRFPPFQYQKANGVVHRKKGWRMLEIQEKEAIMGFPIGHTEHCWNKTERKQNALGYDDMRHTLIGNAWSVFVIATLVQGLCETLGICPRRSVQEVVDLLAPGASSHLGGLLFRPAVHRPPPFQAQEEPPEAALQLVQKLSHQVSAKGTDVLLKASTDGLPRADRFRTSLPARLWKWRTICGWKWKPFDRDAEEHINKLEMRAVYTAIKWRLFRAKSPGKRCLHLVDSMVSLQVLNKGRSSSRKLRVLTKKMTALLIAGRLLLLLAYTHTSQNPADRPSRASVKRKW